MGNKLQRFILMNGHREVLKYAESTGGAIELEAWDENALRSYTVYGNTVCSVKSPSPETPGTLSSVGDYNPLTGRYRLSVKATNENLLGIDEFFSLLTEKIPGMEALEVNGFMKYLLPASDTPWEIVTPSELRFLPKHTFTCNGLFMESNKTQSVRYTGIEFGLAEISSVRALTLGAGSEMMFARLTLLSDYSITRIQMRYIDDTYRSIDKKHFGMYSGTRTSMYYTPHAEQQTTLVLPQPLRGIQDGTNIRADSVNSQGGILRCIGVYQYQENDNMTLYSTTPYPVYYVQLTVPGDPSFPKVTSDMLLYDSQNAIGTVANACCLNSTGTGILFTLQTDTTYLDARNFLLEQKPTFVYALRDTTAEMVTGVTPKVFADYTYTCVLSKITPLLYTVNYV